MTAAPRAHAMRRRLRYGLTSAVLLAAATLAVALAVALAGRHRLRIDATATREHTLSARSRALLADLTQPHEIVVVADFASVDQRARERINDVLQEFVRTSPLLTFSRIDTREGPDRAAYGALLDRLADLHKAKLDAHIAAATEAAADAELLAQTLPRLADRLGALAGALPPGDAKAKVMTDAAGAARTWAADLAHVAETARAALTQRLAGSNIPPVDRAEQALLPPFRRLADELDPLRVYLRSLSGSLSDGALDACRSAEQAAATLRDQAAADVDKLARLPTLELLSIVRTIELGPAAIVVSPTGAIAVNFEALFPTREKIEMSASREANLRFSGEELIATALGSLSNRAAPMIVIVHAGAQRLLDETGRPATSDSARLMERMLEQLALRRLDVREWAVTLEETRPAFPGSRPAGGEHPLVWVVVPIIGTTPDSAVRIGKLSTALQGLIDQGESLLLSLEPSTLPGVGEVDPMAVLALPFGIRVDSGRPILRRFSTPQGWTVLPGQEVVGEGGVNAVADALAGQRTILPWPLPIDLLPPPGSEPAGPPPEEDRQAWPLLRIPAAPDVWAESQWLEFRALAPQQRAMVANPPQPEEKWDDVSGPWIVAAAGQRRMRDLGRSQRMVVVGANGWFLDQFTQQTRNVDGVTGLAFPGNWDLFESSIYWLAGQDELVAPSARTRRIPTIPAMDAARLGALRWALVAGLPALVLAIGLGVRIFRG